MSRPLRGLAVFSALSLVPARARAQTPPDPAVEGTPLVVEIVEKAPRRTSSDPRTELRLTGDDLAKQGVQNLAEALELLPDVTAHENRRGGIPVDIRGARQRAVMVIIDGVPVDEPWRGQFDLTSVPVTEIVELRVTTSPASPLDGSGGSGGVVEIVTMKARGGRLVAAQLRGSDAPELQGAATGRADVARFLATRVSAGGVVNERIHDAIMPDLTLKQLDENRRAAYVSARFEAEHPQGRLTADLFGQHRSFLVPPDDDAPTGVQVVDGEDSFRGIVGGDRDSGGWLLVARGYGQVLRRQSTSYPDASLTMSAGDEDLAADREGGMFEAERGFEGLRLGARLAFDSERARDTLTAAATSNTQGGRSSLGQAAAGATWTVHGVTLDGAAGVVVPFVGDAEPWPEAKLSVGWLPFRQLELSAIGARKGRLPTLRERFDPLSGNPDLGPERITFGEVGARIRPVELVDLKLAFYERLNEGLIRVSPTSNTLENLADIESHGVEAYATVGAMMPLGGGIAYNYAAASSPTLGPDPLDFLPKHRVDVWAQARYDLRAGAWTRVRWTDERIDMAMVLGAYTIVEASVWAQIFHDLRASLRVDNILDEEYRSRAGLLAEGRRFTLVVDGMWR